MQEVLVIAPTPDQNLLDALRERSPEVAATVQRGLDPLGNARARLTLSHPDSARLAHVREAWLAALRAAGYSAFVV